MRILLALGLLFVLAASAAALPNLLGNGDFATPGVLAPWTAASGSPTVAAGVCTLDNAAIRQTVATTAGGRYYLALDTTGLATVSFTAAPAAGGGPDASGAATFGTRSVVFTASSASTTLTLTGTSIGFAPTVDNVVLVELGTNPHTGKYTGTVTETSALDGVALSNTASRRVRAAVDADGRLYVLDGAGVVWAGMLFSDATFVLRAQGTVHRGTATVKGRRIEFTFAGVLPGALDEGGNVVSGTLSTKVVLNRSK
jgi:hypothetical protein